MNRFLVSVVVFAASIACPLSAADAPIQCTLNSLVRSVDVVYSEPGQPLPCDVIYRKHEEATGKSLWRAVNEADYCETKAAAFVEKLQSMGWQCAQATADESPETQRSSETQ